VTGQYRPSQAFTERAQQLVTEFAQNPSAAREGLRELLDADKAGFCVAVLPFLKEEQESPGRQYLLVLMVAHGLLPLCNPDLLSLEEEVRLARSLTQIDPLLDTKLAKRFSISQAAGADRMDPAVAERILNILSAISGTSRVLPMLVHLLRNPDPRLRSKAALLIGKASRNVQRAAEALDETDARVRANSIEALWDVNTDAARAVLWSAAKDANNRVAGNALYGLYRLGDTAMIRPLIEMVAHASPAVRATAAWIMGRTGDPRFVPVLSTMIREPDPVARHSVFRALPLLKQATAKAARAPRLKIQICEFKELPEGWRSVRAAAAREDGKPLPALLPTSFLLKENSKIVVDYSVEHWSVPGALSVGFAIPAARNRQDESTYAALEACLSLKRNADACAVASYPADPAAPRKPDPGAGPEAAAADPEPCRFSSDVDTILRNARNPPRASELDAVQCVLNALSTGPGVRHLVLVVNSLSPSDGESVQQAWDRIVKQAKIGSVAISVVALAGAVAGTLPDVCDQTGGLFLLAGSVDRVADTCRRLYLCLMDRYDIRYRPEEIEPARELALQVYAPGGYGEDALTVV
jgi:HEAT repeat protein